MAPSVALFSGSWDEVNACPANGYSENQKAGVGREDLLPRRLPTFSRVGDPNQFSILEVDCLHVSSRRLF